MKQDIKTRIDATEKKLRDALAHRDDALKVYINEVAKFVRSKCTEVANDDWGKYEALRTATKEDHTEFFAAIATLENETWDTVNNRLRHHLDDPERAIRLSIGALCELYRRKGWMATSALEKTYDLTDDDGDRYLGELRWANTLDDKWQAHSRCVRECESPSNELELVKEEQLCIERRSQTDCE
jgi:hypothetical protein